MHPIAHGGRLIEAMRRHPDAPRPFLDLSTGINPAAYPFTPPGDAAWRRLPEPEQVQALEAAAARAYGVADPAMVVAAPGTQALIQLLPRLFPRRAVAIPGPTYAEHAAAWAAAGAVLAAEADTVVLCNPNNPDGRTHAPRALRDRAAGLSLLVVDEAFADFAPELSLAPLLPLPNVVVLRSFGKAYGLAGLRLGFALAAPNVAARLRAALGPWALSGPAIAIGQQALADTAWRIAARRAAEQGATRMDALLAEAGLSLVGGTALFRTAAHADASGFAVRLATQGILVRAFTDRPTWLRFGLPPDGTAWTRLRAALLRA